MKKVILFASVLVMLSFSACDDVLDAMKDLEQGGNDEIPLTGEPIKSVAYVSSDDPEENILMEFSYDDQKRITEVKSTYTYEGDDDSEVYALSYQYESNKVICSGDDEFTAVLNADSCIESELSDDSEAEYTYDLKDRLVSSIKSEDAPENKYTWLGGNIIAAHYKSGDDDDLNGDGVVDDKDKLESTTSFIYSSYPNNFNLNLALIAQNSDFDEFEYAFASDLFGARSANLVSTVTSVYKCSDFTEYSVDSYEYIYTDELLTSIKITKVIADSQEGIAAADKEIVTLTLAY